MNTSMQPSSGQSRSVMLLLLMMSGPSFIALSMQLPVQPDESHPLDNASQTFS